MKSFLPPISVTSSSPFPPTTLFLLEWVSGSNKTVLFPFNTWTSFRRGQKCDHKSSLSNTYTSFMRVTYIISRKWCWLFPREQIPDEKRRWWENGNPSSWEGMKNHDGAFRRNRENVSISNISWGGGLDCDTVIIVTIWISRKAQENSLSLSSSLLSLSLQLYCWIIHL